MVQTHEVSPNLAVTNISCHELLQNSFNIKANPDLFFVYFRPFLIPITKTVSISTI